MKKRTILMIIFTVTVVIIQLFGIPYLGIISTSHSIEFDYVYNWDLIGTGGWYEGYTETFRSSGHYSVDFNVDTADVTATVTWTWEENYLHTGDSDIENYLFTYSLINGSYLSGDDQDYDATGLNVWFHIPNGVTASSYEILDTYYDVLGDGVIWVGHLMPFIGKQLHSEGIYNRNDTYGQFDVEFNTDNYFSPEGYLIGEVYTEHDEGYDQETGLWSVFDLNSVLFVTSSSYLRPFCFGYYFLAYWFPLLFFLVLFYVIYEKLRWRPRVISRGSWEKDIIIRRTSPSNTEISSFSSAYLDLIPTYMTRARSQGKQVIYAHNQKEILGIGFIEPKGKMGTFYGKFTKELVKFANVKFAFTEMRQLPNFRSIETYDVFQIDNLQQRDFNFDTDHIKATIEPYLNSIMRMIANEDSGKKSEKYAKWVLNSFRDDIAVAATATKQEDWINRIMSELFRHNYPKPEIRGNEILLGVGFATPGLGTGWLYGLYVHPAFRNHGIGRMLVLARLSALKEMGCNTAITEIAEWNSPAKNIYDDFRAERIGKMNLLGKKMPKVKVRRY
ncbi:MAG: GNAT family N-acetyltransferase [Candidatus Lokiarchaeota archaeon]|nr:GNAT family N-acetyltransferase [Candidatus Lokiarchaeota archaeon]